MSLDHLRRLYRPGSSIYLVGLTTRSRLVLCYLAYRANRYADAHGNPPDVAPVTPQQIAVSAWGLPWDGPQGSTGRAVRRSVTELADRGLVKRVPNADPKVRAEALLLLGPLSEPYKSGSGPD